MAIKSYYPGDRDVFHTMRSTLRSWMFIYAALVAAIVLASQPVSVADRATTDSGLRPLVTDTPLGRSDI